MAKLKPKPITEEFWASLTPKQRWDVMVALRGPDLVDGSVLKWYTTGVIRGAVEGIIRPEGGSATINRQLGFIVYPIGPSDQMGMFDWVHFLGHIQEAAYILGIPKLQVPGEVFWPATQKMGRSVELIREWVVKEDELEKASKYPSMVYQPFIHALTQLVGVI